MEIQDVVLATNEGLSRAPDLLTSQPPPRDRFQLADGLWVGSLDDAIAEKVLDSCEPPGCWVTRPVRQYGQLYTFVREQVPQTHIYEWDADLRLQTCVALSRLVHPTSVSFRYSAQLVYNADGTVREVAPGPVTDHGANAWVATEDNRDWLIASDLEMLKELVRHLPLSHLPPRVRRALWYHEYAARTRDVSVRWTLISTALEALVHTDRHNSTRQFTVRIPRLAAEMGGCRFSEGDAENAYDFRSRLSHGQGLGDLTAADRQIYQEMETILRHTLLRAIRDPQFAQLFGNDEGIRKQWPLP